MKIGLDSYSLRFQGFSARDLLRFCEQFSLEVLSLDLTCFPTTPAAGREIASMAANLGVTLMASGPPLLQCGPEPSTAIYATPAADFEHCLETALALKATSLRTFALPARHDSSWKKSLTKLALEQLQMLSNAAASTGVEIVLENHQDLSAKELLGLAGRCGCAKCGVCFDFGNQISVRESPLLALETLAGTIRVCHLKDIAVSFDADGFFWRAVPLGVGCLPLQSMMSRCVSLGITTFLLEISTSRPPTFVSLATTRRRGTTSSDDAFARFLFEHQRWPPEVDHYYSRGSSSRAKVAEQDLVHIQRSIQWTKSAIAVMRKEGRG
jgi:sugar phosphate isomerase/epimerase